MKIKNQKNKSGISLIVLVITIIVIIILTAAIILSIDNNNPIENAKKAKSLHNESVYQEELELYALNEYSNENSKFNKNALNVFNSENIKTYISSMLDEDKDKYIIWQGKLVKKDGEEYNYLNGEKVMVFGELDAEGNIINQVPLTENKVNFAKALEEKQKTITNENERLIYNGGYITNCAKTDGKMLLSSTFITKLPSGYTVKDFQSNTLLTGGYIGTGNTIYYGTELVAKTIFFGDVDISQDPTMNNFDGNTARVLVQDKGKGYKFEQIISANIIGDNILNMEEADLLKSNWGSYYKIINQNRPAIMPTFN